MMERILKLGVLFAITMGLTISLSPNRAYGESHIMADITKELCKDRSLGNKLYQKIFMGDLKTKRDIYYSNNSYHPKLDVTSSSRTTRIKEYDSFKREGRDIAKFIWKRVLRVVRKDLRRQLKEQYGSSPRPVVTTSFSPTLVFPHQKPVNQFRPRIRVGSDYLKPGFTLKNTLNTNVDIGASYHSLDRVLEAKLSSRLYKKIDFKVENHSNFSTPQFENRVSFSFSFGF